MNFILNSQNDTPPAISPNPFPPPPRPRLPHVTRTTHYLLDSNSLMMQEYKRKNTCHLSHRNFDEELVFRVSQNFKDKE